MTSLWRETSTSNREAGASGAGVAALSVEGLSKNFGTVVALDDLSFSLGAEERLALVGPSGCGKSTLLRAIAGLAPADTGRIVLNGRTVDDGRHHAPPENRRIGLVFQDDALFPHLRVADNISFGIRDSTREAVRRRVDQVLELIGLRGYGSRYPHELSGGERQRIALARALAPTPALMLFDEPFASLDPNLRVQLRADVSAALRETRTPAVFVTHDQAEAMAMGDRIAVMRSGRIEQIAEPPVVYHRPVNRFVGAFMGEASFLPIDEAATNPHSALGPVEAHGPVAAGSVAMVRPDDITLTVDDRADAQVIGTEFRGAMWAYTIRLSDGQTVTATGSHLDHIPLGALVRVSLTPGHRQTVLSAGS